MKKAISYLMGFVLSMAMIPTVSAYTYTNTNATLCYNFEESRYEECTHAHVNTNYGWSNVYTNSYYYPSTTRVATQTYNRPVTRYVCDYDYYYGNRCYYKTDYVKTYTSTPVYNYNNYSNTYPYYGTGYSSVGYNVYNSYRYNTLNTYSYPYNYSSYGSNYPYSYSYY